MFTCRRGARGQHTTKSVPRLRRNWAGGGGKPLKTKCIVNIYMYTHMFTCRRGARGQGKTRSGPRLNGGREGVTPPD